MPSVRSRIDVCHTLALADGLIHYVAECLRQAVPHARWEVGHSEIPNHVIEGQPVLVGFAAPVDPVLPMMNLVGQHLLPPDWPYYRRTPSTHDLRNWFDVMVNLAVPGEAG